MIEVLEVTKQHGNDPHIIDSLTKIIDARYQHISEIFTNNIENEGVFHNVTEDDKEDLARTKEQRISDFSFPSYKSDKSVHEISFYNSKKEASDLLVMESKSSPSEIMIFQDYKVQNNSIEEINELLLSDIKETPKAALVSRGSPISDISENEIETKLNKIVMSPEVICEFSEFIILQCLNQELSPYKNNQQQLSIEKDSYKIQEYLDSLIFIIQSNPFELKSIISKPLRKNPLETLAKIQGLDKPICGDWNFFTCPFVINPSICVELEKASKYSNEKIKNSQKAHDKMVFDNCNEFLQTLRPYGIQGAPNP